MLWYEQSAADAPPVSTRAETYLNVATLSAEDVATATYTTAAGATITLPGWPARPLQVVPYVDRAALEAAHPAGVASFHLSGGWIGTRDIPFTQDYADGGWPPEIPALDAATYNALQGVDATAPITIPLPMVTAGSAWSASASASLVDLGSSVGVTWHMGASPGTSVTFPANAVAPGHRCLLTLNLSRRRVTPIAGSAGAQSRSSFTRTTTILFTTAPVGGACPADLDDGSRTGTPDGAVDINDLTYFLIRFEEGDARVDLDDGSGAGTPDGAVTIEDLVWFLEVLQRSC